MGKYQELVRIEKHPYFYSNPHTGKITFRKTINGERVKIPTRESSITKAKLIVEDRLRELYSADPKADKRESLGILNPLVKDIWLELLEEKKATGSEVSTMTSYETSWTHGFGAFWEMKTCRDVTEKSVKQFEAWYLKHNPTRGFFNTGKHLGMLFRYMAKSGYISKAPEIMGLDEVISKNTKRESVGRVFTDDEVESILTHANGRTRLGVLIARYMGPRKNEFLTLERRRIHWEESYAEIWSFKNKRWREVPIPPHVLKAMRAWCDKTEGPYLFPAPTDPSRYLASQVFDKDWTRAKVAAEIKDATVENAARIHDLRHTFATQTARDNWPPAVACRVLDMSLSVYMKTYVHITRDDIFKWMSKSFGGRK